MGSREEVLGDWAGGTEHEALAGGGESASSAAGLGGEGGRELLVEVEEVFEALAFGVEAVAPVAGVDGAVEGLMGAAEGRAVVGTHVRSNGHSPEATGGLIGIMP